MLVLCQELRLSRFVDLFPCYVVYLLVMDDCPTTIIVPVIVSILPTRVRNMDTERAICTDCDDGLSHGLGIVPVLPFLVFCIIVGSRGGSRTHTVLILSQVPLPLGYSAYFLIFL